MKRTTHDISAGDDHILVVPVQRRQYTGLHQHMPQKKATMRDIKPNKKIVQKTGPFRFTWLATLCLVPLLMLGIGFTQVLALKRDLGDSALQTKIAFDTGVQALANEQYARSAEAFLEVARLIDEMEGKLQPLFLSNLFVHKDDPALLTLLQAGEDFARIGLRLTALAPELRALPQSALRGENILPQLARLESEVEQVDSSLAAVQDALDDLPVALIPGEAAKRAEAITELLPQARMAVDSLLAGIRAGEQLLGLEHPHTMAVFFQNSNEIRATGGFPGSMAFVTGNDGQSEFEFRDIYSFSWQNGTQFPPPPGFERLADKLHLQDANYSFHYPASAARLRSMLEYTKGGTAETVVVITDDLFAALLDAVGPLPLPETDEQLSGQNASFLLSFVVEAKLSGRHSPKSVMAEMLPELQRRVAALPPEQLAQLIKRAIREKWVLAHSTDPEIQHFITLLGIDGAIRSPQKPDYLAVVSANVGGNKSDAFLEESLHIASAVALDGGVTNELTITRTHTWGEAQANEVARLLDRYGSGHTAPPLMRYILGAGENHSYTQVFVPAGSELLAVEGVPPEQVIEEERHGKTVYSFRYPAVAAGREEAVILRYRLPQPLAAAEMFDLYYQHQPGRESVRVTREVVAEAGIEVTSGAVAGRDLTGDAVFRAELSR